MDMTLFYFLFILIIIMVGIGVYIQTQEGKEETPVIYANGWEKHDLKTWRKRGQDLAIDKNTKSIIKNANELDLLGILYITYGWDLVKCE